MVRVILERDPHQLFLEDAAGWLALSYVRPKDYVVWNEFLQSVQDIYWPLDHSQSKMASAPAALLLLQGTPNSRRCPGPPTGALPLPMARLVSSGQMLPQQVAYLRYDSKREALTREDSINDDNDNVSLCSSLESNGGDDDDDDDDDSRMSFGGSVSPEDIADLMLSLDQALQRRQLPCGSS